MIGSCEHITRLDRFRLTLFAYPRTNANVVEAVARLRAEAAAAASVAPTATAQEQIDKMERRGLQLCAGFQRTAKAADSGGRQLLIGTIRKIHLRFTRREMEIGS